MDTSQHGSRQLPPSSESTSTAGVAYRTAPDQPDGASATLTAQVSRMLCDAWRFRVDGPWTTALPAEGEYEANALDVDALTDACCRLHLSATPRSAATMLRCAVPVLAERDVTFTFAADLEVVRWLGSRDCDHDLAGKVLTAYPTAGVDVVELTHALHVATDGLPGPRVLSGQPYRSRSLVHTGFGRSVATRTGSVGGTPRNLLAGRYLIGQTLRRTPSNSTYLAVDTRARDDQNVSGHEDTRVVLEHARHHADVDEFGHDARTRLLHQAKVLRELQHVVPVPEPRRVFALDQDLFLVQRYLGGVSFTRWVAAHAADSSGVPVPTAIPMARQLLRIVSAAHHAGFVLRGLAPATVLVAPDGQPMLSGTEAACPVGEVGRRLEPGPYRAPEQALATGPPVASAEEDLYSLGGLLFLLATGIDPTLPAHDDGSDRQDRLATWLDAAVAHSDTARTLASTTLGLLADDPAHRCDLVTAAARLQPRHPARIERPAAACPGPRRLLDDGLSYLADVVTTTAGQLSTTGDDANPGSVQHGVSGVLAVLLTDLATGNHRHIDAARTAAARLVQNGATAGNSSPGLYHGDAGAAWILADAGSLLSDPVCWERAEELTRGLPTTWPTAGVSAGLAGTLLTQLKLYAMTGRAEFATLASACVREIRRSARSTPEGPLWPLPDGFDPAASGTVHYGFAHGVAGVAYALLAAGSALGDQRATDLASEAGALLCDVALPDTEGGLQWPVGPDNPRRRSHWCTGASGIGSFLLRLWEHTSETSFATYARGALRTVVSTGWTASTTACHGIAGDGQFLLDAAEAFADPRYRQRAADLVPILSARHARRRARVVVADDTGAAISPGYGTGLAGVVAYLLRLEHLGPRPFMLDDLFPARAPGTSRAISAKSALTGRTLA